MSLSIPRMAPRWYCQQKYLQSKISKSAIYTTKIAQRLLHSVLLHRQHLYRASNTFRTLQRLTDARLACLFLPLFLEITRRDHCEPSQNARVSSRYTPTNNAPFEAAMADPRGVENVFSSSSQEFNLQLSSLSKSPSNRSKRSLQFASLEGIKQEHH